jgi:hypothetical protein
MLIDSVVDTVLPFSVADIVAVGIVPSSAAVKLQLALTFDGRLVLEILTRPPPEQAVVLVCAERLTVPAKAFPSLVLTLMAEIT